MKDAVSSNKITDKHQGRLIFTEQKKKLGY